MSQPIEMFLENKTKNPTIAISAKDRWSVILRFEDVKSRDKFYKYLYYRLHPEKTLAKGEDVD
jgi:hypothetical protein